MGGSKNSIKNLLKKYYIEGQEINNLKKNYTQNKSTNIKITDKAP